MKSGFVCVIAFAAILFLFCASASAAIPQQINYQGRLTDPNGDPLAGPVELVFSICTDSLCTTTLWSETHSGVVLNEGMFSILLGTLTPIPVSVFDGSLRYLSASLNGQPATRRIAIGSIGYAYHSAVSDTAVVLRGGGTTDCADCNATFVNVIGPDSVYVSQGTAFLGKAAGARTSDLFGLKGYASNTSSGDAFAGRFEVATGGTGIHYGVSAGAQGNSVSGVYGLEATAYCSGTGSAFGASLTAGGTGNGPRYGAYINSDGVGTGATFGVWSEASNSFTGDAYGGYFRGASDGTGDHIGVSGSGNCASDANAYGSYGYASNTSTGDAYGGYFSTTASGSGVHYGAKAQANGASSSPVHGFQGIGENTGGGSTYGGSFFAHADGTGHHYGIYSEASGNSSNEAFGMYSIASNSGAGESFGGYFAANGPSGTGRTTAVSGESTNNGSSDAIGVYGWAQNNAPNSDIRVYGGLFGVSDVGSGEKVALYAEAPQHDGSHAGVFYGNVWMSSNLWVGGSIFEVGKMDDNTYRTVHSQQSTEAWIEDLGGARLVGGKAHVELEPLYLQTITIDEKHQMRVFVQLEGNCNGVYVETGKTGFDVIELANGKSDAAFSYRIVAKRKGYEDKRLDLLEGPTPEEREVMRARLNSELAASRAKIQEGQQRIQLEHKTAIQEPVEPDAE